MEKKAKLKIYILGFIPKKVTGIVLKKYINAQLELEKNNYTVYNPVVNMIDSKLTYDEAYRSNLRELLSSDAVYLIFDSSQNFKNSEELKIALKSNKILLHQTLVIEDIKPFDIDLSKTKARLKKHSRKYTS